MTVDGDVSTHASHFAGVQETIFENSFGDSRSALGLRGQSHVLRLHVCGEAGIFLGGDVGGDEFVAVVDAKSGVIENFNGDAGGLQLGDDGVEVRGIAIGDGEVAIGDGAGDEEGAGLDAVGDDGVRGAMKKLDAMDGEGAGIVAPDARAHFAEEMDEVGDFGFASTILESGDAVGERSGHEDIFRAGDGDFFEDDVRAFEAAAVRNSCLDVAVFGGDEGTHFFERGEMEIHGARANGTTAGKRNMGDAGAGDGGAEGEDRGAHGFDEFVRSDGVIEGFGLNGVSGGRNFVGINVGRHEGEELAHGDDVADEGNVVEGDGLEGEERGGHKRKSGILGAGDVDRAVKWIAAVDAKFIHEFFLRNFGG